jgi:hypothetical protein
MGLMTIAHGLYSARKGGTVARPKAILSNRFFMRAGFGQERQLDTNQCRPATCIQSINRTQFESKAQSIVEVFFQG